MEREFPWDEGFPLRDFPAYSDTQSQLGSASGISSSWQESGLPVSPPLVGVLPLQRPINTFDEPSQPVGFNRPGDNTFVIQNDPVMQFGVQSEPFLAVESQISEQGDAYCPLQQLLNRFGGPSQSVTRSGFGSNQQGYFMSPEEELGAGPECRCEAYDLYMIGAIGNHSRPQDGPTTDFQRYDFDTTEWCMLNNDVVEQRRTGFAVATLQNEIWVLGGCVTLKDKEIFKRDVFVYSIRSGEWATGEKMDQPRADFCAAVVGDNLYAIGGRHTRSETDGTARYTTVEGFTKKGKFPVQSMNLARSSFASCVVGKKIYVAGGVTRYPNKSTVEFYTTSCNQWTKLVINLPNTRESFGLVYVNDQLYAVGGDRDGSVIRRDKYGGQWSHTIIYLPEGLHSYDVFSLGGDIYVLGKTETGQERFCKFRPTDSRPEWVVLHQVPCNPRDGGTRVTLFKNRSCEVNQNARSSVLQVER